MEHSVFTVTVEDVIWKRNMMMVWIITWGKIKLCFRKLSWKGIIEEWKHCAGAKTIVSWEWKRGGWQYTVYETVRDKWTAPWILIETVGARWYGEENFCRRKFKYFPCSVITGRKVEKLLICRSNVDVSFDSPMFVHHGTFHFSVFFQCLETLLKHSFSKTMFDIFSYCPSLFFETLFGLSCAEQVYLNRIHLLNDMVYMNNLYYDICHWFIIYESF